MMEQTASVSGGSDESRELAQLLRRVADKDSSALKTLYERTSSKLYGICLRLLGDEAEAQDMLQEVYVIVWRKAALFDPAKAGVITWTATLARNKAIDRLRRRRGPDEELDERARTLIRSAFFDGASYPELAAREAVPLPTMKSWIRRGLLRLRGCLER
jgi:RNA polymerase sigma-70 factor (ECF subfamily)